MKLFDICQCHFHLVDGLKWHINDQGYVVHGIYDRDTKKTTKVRLPELTTESLQG